MKKPTTTVCFALLAIVLAAPIYPARALGQTAGGFNFARVRMEPGLVGTIQTCDAIDAGAPVPVNDVVRRALSATGDPHPEFTHFVNVRCRSAVGLSYVNAFFAARAAARDFAARLATPTPIRVRILGSTSQSPGIGLVVLAR